MHHLKRLFKILIIAASVSSSITTQAANTAPAEKPAVSLKRTAESGLQLSESLSKNIFRQDSVQVPYTVQEPYSATETYTVTVPYEDTETYYEDVPYQDQETYTDYEYRCEERIHHERVCRDKYDCHIVPGRGPDGGPRRECTSSPECETIPRRTQECGNVPVLKTRWVTRYRQELRTRSVTRYREESRTRTVTKYRDKQVCCKTEIQTVFDHQFRLPVTLQFPAETALLNTEQENFLLQLTGSESAPSVTLNPTTSIFGYSIARQEMHGGTLVVELQREPLYNKEHLGLSTLKGLRLQQTKSGAVLRFTDEGLRPRVTSVYSYQIHEVGSAEVLDQGSLSAQQTSVEIPTAVVLEENKTYQVDLRVQRQGLPLAADIDVVLSATQKISSLQEPAVYTDKNLINTFEIRGEKDQARLFFRDQTPRDEGVQTHYRLEVLLGGAKGKVLSAKDFAREEMPTTTKNFYRLLLGADLGVPAQTLKEKVRAGNEVSIRVTVSRQHASLNEGQPVVLVLSETFTIHQD